MNDRRIVISCFDESTVMVQPWAEAGYDCYCVDIQHEPGMHRDENGIARVGADLRGADLRGADLRGADLRGADLLGAHLPADSDLASLIGVVLAEREVRGD